jgi:hypothetical protein
VGNVVMIGLRFSLTNDSVADLTCYYAVYRDATAIEDPVEILVPGSDSGTWSKVWYDHPAAGTYTYTIKVECGGVGDNDIKAENRALSVKEWLVK